MIIGSARSSPGCANAIWPARFRLAGPRQWLAARRLPGDQGAALTGDQVIAAEPAKRELVSAFPAGACVDMETAALAQVARQNGIAWAAVRMIYNADDVDDQAVLEYLTSGGAMALSSIIRETIDRILDSEPQS